MAVSTDSSITSKACTALRSEHRRLTKSRQLLQCSWCAWLLETLAAGNDLGTVLFLFLCPSCQGWRAGAQKAGEEQQLGPLLPPPSPLLLLPPCCRCLRRLRCCSCRRAADASVIDAAAATTTTICCCHCCCGTPGVHSLLLLLLLLLLLPPPHLWSQRMVEVLSDMQVCITL
jgi:hypothetical protein